MIITVTKEWDSLSSYTNHSMEIKDPHHYHWRHHPAITSEKIIAHLDELLKPGRGAARGRTAMTTPDLFTTAPWRLGKDRSDTCFCMVGYIIYIFIIFYMYIHVCSMCISMHNIYIHTSIWMYATYTYICIYTSIHWLDNLHCTSCTVWTSHVFIYILFLYVHAIYVYIYIHIYINNIYIRDMFQSTRRFGTDMNNNHRFKHHNVDNNSRSCSQR